MLLNVHCISLRVVKHSDSTSIVTVWSEECGRMVFAVPAGSGREAQRRRAMMMPFSLFEGVANIRGGDVSRISDVRPYMAANVTGLDPLKNVIALFLADFLYAVLRESQPDSTLTSFIFDSVSVLKRASSFALANFHLYFIYKLGQFLGISPDTGTYRRGAFFDMRDGIFTMTPPLHNSCLVPHRAKVVNILANLTADNLHHLRVSREVRNEILDGILDYYTLHHTPVAQLPSLQILRSVFH